MSCLMDGAFAKGVGGGLLVLLLIGLPLVGIGSCIGIDHEQRKAIEAGSAHHHPETGEVVYKCKGRE